MATGSISSLGVGSGLELQSMLEQLREVDNKPIETKKTKQTELNDKVEEFNSIKSSLLSIRTKALELSLGSNFIEKKATVSGTSVNATSVSGAREISHNVNVTSLATSSTWASGGFSSKTASVATSDETFSYKLGNGNTLSLNISSGTTLQQLADKINNDKSNPGVIATIADTGFGDNPYKLVLSSKNTGEENRISMVNSNSPITSDSAVNISPGAEIHILSGANDQIVFREKRSDGTLGSDQTATIPQGSYSNPNYFASAIKTAMESASTNGTKFSVSFDDTTKKFSIKEDGSTLNELQIDWVLSSSASALGFDAEMDTYKKPYYSMLNLTETNGAGKTPSISDNTVSLKEALNISNAASNNKIVFRERLANGELGEEKTATIADDGSYINGNDLASAIKTAMESASTNGTKFSVLFDDTTHKLTIKEDGSNLHELQMVWSKSNAASSLGFDSETDIYKPYDSILNARFTVDGIDYQRQSNNEITDVVSGISLDLKETGSSSFKVDSDFEKVQKDIEEIISTFNTLASDMSTKSKYDLNTGEKGILFGETAVLRIDDDIKSLFTQKINTGSSITTMYDLGLETKDDGSLSINTKTLQKAFSSNPDDVIKFFTGDAEKGTDGFADILYDKMSDYTGAKGLMTSEIESAQTRINKMDTEIQEDTKRLDQRYESLTKQFVKLDSFMSQMKSQSSFLDMMFNNSSKED